MPRGLSPVLLPERGEQGLWPPPGMVAPGCSALARGSHSQPLPGQAGRAGLLSVPRERAMGWDGCCRVSCPPRPRSCPEPGLGSAAARHRRSSSTRCRHSVSPGSLGEPPPPPRAVHASCPIPSRSSVFRPHSPRGTIAPPGSTSDRAEDAGNGNKRARALQTIG